MIELFGFAFNIDFLRLILIVLPMYFTNSSALLLGGGKLPLDFGLKFFDGKPLFGKSKTWKGAINAIIAGTVTALILTIIFSNTAYVCPEVQCQKPLEFVPDYVVYGFLSSFGAILGDALGSFAKRRLGIESGKESVILDQLPFVLVALAVTSGMFLPNLEEFVVIIILTIIMHRFANWLAFNLHLKKVPY
ncbi:MAG: CDP-2,3-bis-(O-geranylgeranyl)-sn-glycerol synthase [Candidatus Diapherotrites archaeon]|nr:CDP-2,3-bis-(O-geranylgeranyl)-sn-glycerol synthase [Candidatus Diapherotrites archaeon]